MIYPRRAHLLRFLLVLILTTLMRPAAAEPRAAESADLPLVERPAGPGDWLAVMVSGDGGWSRLDNAVAAELQRRGVAVVGLNSLRYLSHERTPAETGADLGRILDAYMQLWNRRRAIVIGYSLGADIAPFMVNRLPAALQTKVRGLALLSAGLNAEFKFHVLNWLGHPPDGPPLLPELAKLPDTIALLCVHGASETDGVCPMLPGGVAQDVELPGGHHYQHDYAALASAITSWLSGLDRGSGVSGRPPTASATPPDSMSRQKVR